MRRLAPLLLSVACARFAVAGCGTSDSASPPADDAGSSGGDATPTDGGADVVVPPGCELGKEPKDSTACVDDGVGVFVDATRGLDTNPATKALPAKTLAAALAKRAGKPRVYVCEGTYPEALKLTDAVALYGGFACQTWTPSATKPLVAPTEPGYALLIDKAAQSPITVADLAFTAAPGTAASPSSIAAFVASSEKVTLLRVALTAKDAAKGKDETKAADGALLSSTPTAASLDGNGGNATIGGLAQLCTCVGGATSKGGGGGNVNGDGNNGETAQATPEPASATGAGQTATDCLNGTGSPRPGSNAPSALAADGAKRLGELTATGWAPEPGKSGLRGGAGQGGGGGGGSGGGGGGGACGGCGGEGGKGGAGGGASIALLTFDSPVAVIDATLTSAAAGNGGAGGPGGDGILGGTKGARGGAACDGGNGGRGGNGGAGGGGAGGVSVGVLYKGRKPNVAASFTTGALGNPGLGPAANDGIQGAKADTLESP